MENGSTCAFPADSRTHTDGGLTKREYFAAMAMNAYAQGEYTAQSGMPCAMIARWSVEMADTLLAELDKTKSE